MKAQAVTTEYGRTQAAQKRETYTAGVIGALAGYGAKYALPVFKFEKDTFTSSTRIKKISDQIEGARAGEFKLIRAQIEESPHNFEKGVSEFLSDNKGALILDKKDELKKAIDAFSGTARKNVEEIIKRVDSVGNDAAHIAKNDALAVMKKERPTAMFILLGIAIAASIVTLKNALSRTESVYIEEYKNKNRTGNLEGM